MRRDRDVRRAATKAKHRAATKARDERKRIALDQQLDQLHQRVEQPATIGSQQTVKLSSAKSKSKTARDMDKTIEALDLLLK